MRLWLSSKPRLEKRETFSSVYARPEREAGGPPKRAARSLTSLHARPENEVNNLQNGRDDLQDEERIIHGASFPSACRELRRSLLTRESFARARESAYDAPCRGVASVQIEGAGCVLPRLAFSFLGVSVAFPSNQGVQSSLARRKARGRRASLAAGGSVQGGSFSHLVTLPDQVHFGREYACAPVQCQALDCVNNRPIPGTYDAVTVPQKPQDPPCRVNRRRSTIVLKGRIRTAACRWSLCPK